MILVNYLVYDYWIGRCGAKWWMSGISNFCRQF